MPTIRGMDVGSATSATSWSGLASSPATTMLQAQATTDSSLFAGATGEPSDLVQLTSAATAMPLYQVPGLLTGLTQWDGSQTPGSQRTPPPTDAGAQAITPQFSFDPFDQKSWDTSWQTSTPSSPDASSSTSPSSASGTAPGEGTVTGTGVVVPPPQYSFNPFDQKSWDVQSPKGSTVDALA